MPASTRLGLRTAGAEVDARAQQLSDDLLELELWAFDTIFARFSDLAVGAAGQLERRRSLLPHLDAAMAEAGDVTTLLVGHSVDAALAALGDELALVEATRSRHGAGMADKAVLAAHRRAQGAIDEALALTDHPTVRRGAQLGFSRQSALAHSYPELHLRLFSTVPLRLFGCSGRGAWFQPAGWLQAQARHISLTAVSKVRLAGIGAMNG